MKKQEFPIILRILSPNMEEVWNKQKDSITSDKHYLDYEKISEIGTRLQYHYGNYLVSKSSSTFSELNKRELNLKHLREKKSSELTRGYHKLLIGKPAIPKQPKDWEFVLNRGILPIYMQKIEDKEDIYSTGKECLIRDIDLGITKNGTLEGITIIPILNSSSFDIDISQEESWKRTLNEIGKRTIRPSGDTPLYNSFF
ncbi:MAG: hypothetical protein ACOCUU_02580 [Nanoarchaeota archaeon]